MRKKATLAQVIVEHCLNKLEKDLNILQLSNALKMVNSTLWFKLAGKRKWDVETWITVLYIADACRIRDGKIVIMCPLPDHVRRRMIKAKEEYTKGINKAKKKTRRNA